MEGARFPGACAAVTNPRGSPSSPVLLVAQAAAEALHAPEFTKFIIILIQGAAPTFSYFTAVPYFSQSSQVPSQLTVISDCSVIHAVNFE